MDHGSVIFFCGPHGYINFWWIIGARNNFWWSVRWFWYVPLLPFFSGPWVIISFLMDDGEENSLLFGPQINKLIFGGPFISKLIFGGPFISKLIFGGPIILNIKYNFPGPWGSKHIFVDKDVVLFEKRKSSWKVPWIIFSIWMFIFRNQRYTRRYWIRSRAVQVKISFQTIFEFGQWWYRPCR